MSEYTDRLRVERESALNKAVALCDTAAAESRELTEAEQTDYDVNIKRADALEKEIAEKGSLDSKRAAATEARASVEAAIAPKVQVTRTESIYTPSGAQSFYRDVFAASRGDSEARERLVRNEREVMDKKPELRDGTTGSGSFGSFIAPVYLIDQYAELARGGRPVANAIRNVGAPTSTSITIPRVTTGSSVASQNGENTNVSETDLVTSTLTRSTVTIAGQQDVSIQSLELANGAQVDQIIFQDLRAAYDAELDRQILNGSGTAGELLGLLNVSSINAVTYTDASPTVAEFYPKLIDAIQRVTSNRYLPANAIIIHPRRWAFLTAGLDGQNRPLVTPVAPWNGLAEFRNFEANGVVGSIAGVPVIVDPNIPTNLGTGTNQDVVAVVRTDDHLLLEGALRTRVLEEVGSASLTVRLQLFAYANYFAGRYPSGISAINGTGLITPTF
jgi:HK97 family phage major capsid protein